MNLEDIRYAMYLITISLSRGVFMPEELPHVYMLHSRMSAFVQQAETDMHNVIQEHVHGKQGDAHTENDDSKR